MGFHREKNDVGDQSAPGMQPAPEEDTNQGLFRIEEQVEGDEFMAVKPWLGAIKAPTNYPKPPANASDSPNVNIVLEHCYGYRAK